MDAQTDAVKAQIDTLMAAQLKFIYSINALLGLVVLETPVVLAYFRNDIKAFVKLGFKLAIEKLKTM